MDDTFLKYLKPENNDFNYLYTQMLTAKRIRENDVVYLFDEVGCGKTVSAIVAMAEVISQCKPDENVDILVVAPLSVCGQFYDEIMDKLNFEAIKDRFNDSLVNVFKLYTKVKIDINSMRSDSRNANYRVNVFVINKDRIGKIKGDINWDLIIIDEAQDIVCNNKKQSKVYNEGNDKIDKYYSKLLELKNNENILDFLKECVTNWENYINSCSQQEGVDEQQIKYLKYLFCNYYERENNSMKANYGLHLNNSDWHRLYETKVFENLSSLKTKKIIFATATPYKENMIIDYMNYTLLSSTMVNNGSFDLKYYPNFAWKDKIYGQDTISESDLDEMEKSNVSYIFKEIATAIPYNLSVKSVKAKQRVVELLREKDKPLKERVSEILNSSSSVGLKNRIVIFVSSSYEGCKVFERIFPNSNHNIFSNNVYYDATDNISCVFIMNLFRNTYKLGEYKKEENNPPDILIVTHQVAQVGVNLPTYNHVINYTISDQPGSLEQRYGRIDRLNSKYDSLYNIYYLDVSDSRIYDINLCIALNKYRDIIVNNDHPTKNLLLGQNLDLVPVDRAEIKLSLKSWVQKYIKMSQTNRKIQLSNSLKQEINNIDSNLLSECLQSDEFKYDEPDSPIFGGNQDDPDVDGTLANKAKRILDENVSRLIREYNGYEEYKQMIDEINSHKNELGNPGSIIYVRKNGNNKTITLNVNDIINNIVQIKTKQGKTAI